tara:strand:- start:428 stop:1735 length:1308 start_codon:yes stop_codon:yes gene_type:complete
MNSLFITSVISSSKIFFTIRKEKKTEARLLFTIVVSIIGLHQNKRLMYNIQSRNYDFNVISCGFRRIDFDDLSKDEHGNELRNLLKQKERLSYIYDMGMNHVYIAKRNELYPDLNVPPIIKSRAGIKLFEIMQRINLSCKNFLDICAGPGAMSDLLLQSFDCCGIGVSLCQNDRSKQFYDSLQNNSKYNIASFEDGDITRIETISDVTAMSDAIFGKYSVDLVIGDGAPSLSYQEEEYQEFYCQKILLGELILALECIKNDGKFILKIFDSFTKFTKCIVYLFTKIFQSTKIIKPPSSRITNAEKYLIGIDFMLSEERRQALIANLHVILSTFQDGYNCEEFVHICRDSRFIQTFGHAMKDLCENQTSALKKILDEIDISIFKVQIEEPVQKGKGKGKKGKGKGKNNYKYAPYKVEIKDTVKEYSPFDDDSVFPD